MTGPDGVPGSPRRTPWGPLADDLVSLAEVPDDADAVVDAFLIRIAAAAAEMIDGVDYASITAWRGDGYTTVAASSDLARAVDDAQHAEAAGPCVQAEQTAAPVGVPDIPASTMSWPRFREQAAELGLQASVSVPLFAGRGTAVAVLNLYGRRASALTALSAAVRDVFVTERIPADSFGAHGNAGTLQLLNGLGLALQLRVAIQRAVGMLMADAGCDAAQAHRMLRARAVAAGESLSTAALQVIDEIGPDPGTAVRVTVGPPVGDVVPVAIDGELTRPVDPALAGRLAEVLDEPALVVEWDLSGLWFCDVAGLRLLLDLWQRATSDGRQMRMVAASDAVRTLMLLTDTAALFGYPAAPESANGDPLE
ncbi:STAS domain-containing protein [Actinoplanes sp. NPDC049681]|uniref:STAS domain-containing protein n=1 Tax=Actinoplanes sp. NPDC049681 TaxID=3363905 RepID=UPI0037AA160D